MDEYRQEVNWKDYVIPGLLLFAAGLMLRRMLSGSRRRRDRARRTYLIQADLRGRDLSAARLRRASVFRSNLKGADLSSADLRQASVFRSNLQGADLSAANLRQARLRRTDLRGANLEDADLRDLSLDRVRFDRATILPDGTAWTRTTDLARFTDSRRPDFWRADGVEPAADQDEDEA